MNHCEYVIIMSLGVYLISLYHKPRNKRARIAIGRIIIIIEDRSGVKTRCILSLKSPEMSTRAVNAMNSAH
jgi:hypothetical protein